MERKREGGKTPDRSLANLREGVAVRARTHARSSYIPHEVLVGLLGVPLLPLLSRLHLGQQRLPVGLVRLDDVLQLLHEEQLQHALVGVQVGQLEQLPLQDVVVPGGGEATRSEPRCWMLDVFVLMHPLRKTPFSIIFIQTEYPRTSRRPWR